METFLIKKSSTDLKLKESEILFEDNHLIIINKKAGVLVQGDITGDISLIEITKDYIKNKYNKKGNVFLGLVNRIVDEGPPIRVRYQLTEHGRNAGRLLSPLVAYMKIQQGRVIIDK